MSPPWQLIYSHEAAASLDRLDRGTSARIQAAIEEYSRTGRGDAKRLQGQHPPMFRLRVGSYRCIFVFEPDWQGTPALLVLSVSQRGAAYRDL